MTPQATSIEATIRRHAQEWMQAGRRRDAAALDQFLTDEFVLVIRAS